MNNLELRNNLKTVKRNKHAANRFEWSNWIDNLINSDFTQFENNDFNHGFSNPKVNISENDESFHLEMAVPGFEKSDFVIDVENEELSISVDQKPKVNETTSYSRKEFGYASFKRTFLLPETVEEDRIEATYNNGILDVKIPKKEEAKPKPAKSIKVS